ncbi:hypothetical protein O3P69_007598 [Scylla paramamosain]|uniref:Secreted protein n=1 Tax=Scylla paramamosain TaxID=85552 RepID=A0AAW0UXJ7_SCYPA
MAWVMAAFPGCVGVARLVMSSDDCFRDVRLRDCLSLPWLEFRPCLRPSPDCATAVKGDQHQPLAHSC